MLTETGLCDVWATIGPQGLVCSCPHRAHVLARKTRRAKEAARHRHRRGHRRRPQIGAGGSRPTNLRPPGYEPNKPRCCQASTSMVKPSRVPSDHLRSCEAGTKFGTKWCLDRQHKIGLGSVRSQDRKITPARGSTGWPGVIVWGSSPAQPDGSGSAAAPHLYVGCWQSCQPPQTGSRTQWDLHLSNLAVPPVCAVAAAACLAADGHPGCYCLWGGFFASGPGRETHVAPGGSPVPCRGISPSP